MDDDKRSADGITYAALINVLDRCGRGEDAFFWFDKAARAGHTGPEVYEPALRALEGEEEARERTIQVMTAVLRKGGGEGIASTGSSRGRSWRCPST